jgi:hypothetical protein
MNKKKPFLTEWLFLFVVVLVTSELQQVFCVILRLLGF